MTTINFSGVDRCIEIAFGSGEDVATVEVADIYSSWKQWALLNPNFFHAMESAGGDDKATGQKIGSVFFLTNEWRICPAPHSSVPRTVLKLEGELYHRQAGFEIFDYDDVGAGQILIIEKLIPATSTVIETGTSGLTAEESALLLKIAKNSGLIPATL